MPFIEDVYQLTDTVTIIIIEMFCFLIGYQMQGMVISAGILVSNMFA